MKRSVALELIKVAGYHGDSMKMLRIYTENRISYKVAQEYFLIGKKLKESEK